MQELTAYTVLLENEISNIKFPQSPSNLYDPLRFFMSIGGKRMRPILTLLGAELFGTRKEDALSAALAVEVFHNFTLIHDDIMDAAPSRRNQPTVHTKWNENIAILSGDVLFIKAYQLLTQQSPKHVLELITLLNKTAVEVCEGQQMDMDFESRTDVEISEYIEMIRLKTSVLLGCALEFGAIISEATNEDKKSINDFGQYIGIAFQIQDDILDLYGDPEKFGKQIGGDVISNKKTLLNLKAFKLADSNQKLLLNQLSTETNLELKVQTVREIYSEIGAKQACEKEMQHYYQKSINALDAINVSSNVKANLISLADFLINREV